MIKAQSFRSNPEKPSVVKEYGLWWAKARHANGGMAVSTHPSQVEAFAAAQRMAGADQ